MTCLYSHSLARRSIRFWRFGVCLPLLTALASVRGAESGSSPERMFAEIKIRDLTVRPWQVAREDWAGARQRVSTDAAWAKWLADERASVEAWMAKHRDRVEWVSGWSHDGVSPKDGSRLVCDERVPGEEVDHFASPSDASAALTEKLIAWWVVEFRGRHLEMMIRAAPLSRLTTEPRYAAWAAGQMDFYTDNLARWPARHEDSAILSATGEPNEVSPNVTAVELQRVRETVQTPYKYGAILCGAPGEMIGSPKVFRLGDGWRIIDIARDGRRHEMRPADLLHGRPLGVVLPRSGPARDAAQAAGAVALLDPRWEGAWKPLSCEGRYWFGYFGGATSGDETPPLWLGLVSTEDPVSSQPWQRLTSGPMDGPKDAGARVFERDTRLKSHVLHDQARTLGAPFVLCDNAGAADVSERIGVAVSDDLRHWRRHGPGFVLGNVAPNGRPAISGDPQVLRIGDLWVMFYSGTFRKPEAFDTFAVARDLEDWTKWTGPHLVAPPEGGDRRYTQKPWDLYHDGVVYRFCRAVGDHDRLTAVAMSRDVLPKKFS